jgi:hypothetical protein
MCNYHSSYRFNAQKVINEYNVLNHFPNNSLLDRCSQGDAASVSFMAGEKHSDIKGDASDKPLASDNGEVEGSSTFFDLETSRKRGRGSITSCGECRRRKQKVFYFSRSL